MFSSVQRLGTAITERSRLALAGLFVSGLVLRVAVVLLRKTYLLDFRGTDHGSIAYSVADGAGYVYHGFPTSYFGPLFTYLWAGLLHWLGPDHGELALELVNAVCLATAPLLLYVFGRLTFTRGVALLAAAWLAFYPEFLILPSTMFAASVLVFLWCAVLALYAWSQRNEGPHLAIALALGVVVGAMILTKGRMAEFACLLVGGLAWRGWHSVARRGRWLLAAAVVVLGAGVVVAPWTIRNLRVHDRLVLFESSFGYNLWLGHNGDATGTGKAQLGASNFSDRDGSAVGFTPPPAMEAELAGAGSEMARDDIYRRHAMADIRARGLGEIGLSLRKVAYAWLLDPTNSLVRSPVYWLPWFVTLACFLGGLVYRVVSEGRRDVLLWLMFLVWTATQVVFFVIPRLRYPIYPLVFLLAAYGVVALFTRRFRGAPA